MKKVILIAVMICSGLLACKKQEQVPQVPAAPAEAAAVVDTTANVDSVPEASSSGEDTTSVQQ